MKIEFAVQNVKCQGCASAIRDRLGKNSQVRAVQVDVPTGQVTVEADSDIRAELGVTLTELGYPEIGLKRPLPSR
ncbi:MAG: heavy-metal-associated domain-containing protein [Candidatus Competibacteraceae bacterium]|nr:heavy-metal-associated domain-containing protein [Candidatus Competibacteraceae bacterium]HRY14900.1 heavy-metal-associated domain-containing protein [Candidatus Competibacteraceae bacterium]